MNIEDIPYFEDPVDKIVPGLPIVERKQVLSIVYDPRNDAVLCMRWHEFGWRTFVNGGVEETDVDLVEAGKREIHEETGYTDVRYVAEIGKVQAAFYNSYKKENRMMAATGLLFELVSDKRDLVDQSETAKHSAEWIPKSETPSYITVDWQLYLWEKVVENI
ncbi:MAG: NUDIX hydrolase [Patescibacteria group bacterium]